MSTYHLELVRRLQAEIRALMTDPRAYAYPNPRTRGQAIDRREQALQNIFRMYA